MPPLSCLSMRWIRRFRLTAICHGLVGKPAAMNHRAIPDGRAHRLSPCAAPLRGDAAPHIQQSPLLGHSDRPREAGQPPALGDSYGDRLRVGLTDAGTAGVQRIVGIPAAIEHLADRVSEWQHDRPPVLEGVVEREDRRLLAPVLGL
jgi:hypothetical protein